MVDDRLLVEGYVLRTRAAQLAHLVSQHASRLHEVRSPVCSRGIQPPPNKTTTSKGRV